MLVVEDLIPNEEVITNQKSFDIDEFIWPHGITPPLKHVRKRRFRKRISRRVSIIMSITSNDILEEYTDYRNCRTGSRAITRRGCAR